MPVVRGEYAELLAPGLQRFTFQRLRERAEEYRRINRVETTDSAYEDSWEMGGFGPLGRKGELAPTQLDEPIKLGGVRIVVDTFALGFLISKEMIADNKFGLMQKLAGALGRSGRITAELYGHDVLNNGFSTAKYAGRDGKALFATDHPIYGGPVSTYSNTQAVAADLSEAALEAALGAYDNMVDERGLPTESTAMYLVISPDNRFLAKRLINSENIPGSNNNDVNPLRNENLNVIVDHWLTDKDAWYLLPAPADNPIVFYWRQMSDTYTWDDLNAGGTFHKIDQRHGVGFDNWRGVWGSQGA